MELKTDGRHDDTMTALLAATTIAKASRGNPRALGRSANQVEARARAMTGAINKWLAKYRRVLIEAEIEAQLKGRIAKADTEASLMQELDRILSAYGLRQVGTAIEGSPVELLPSTAVDSFLREKTVRLQAIREETRAEVRNAVRNTIRRALLERPQPSVGEIARRIRTGFAGPASTALGRKTFEQVAEDATEDGRVLPTAKITADGKDLYAFSNERAALIARTELNQAQNYGHMERMKLAGFTHKEWFAYTDAIYPSGSKRGLGDRRHDLMNGVVVPIGEPFILPDGTQMMYPGDPSAPIKHLANCRCSLGGSDG